MNHPAAANIQAPGEVSVKEESRRFINWRCVYAENKQCFLIVCPGSPRQSSVSGGCRGLPLTTLSPILDNRGAVIGQIRGRSCRDSPRSHPPLLSGGL